MSLSFYKGKALKFEKQVKHVKIDYKLSIPVFICVYGGDKRCGYNLCEFVLEGAGPVSNYLFR